MNIFTLLQVLITTRYYSYAEETDQTNKNEALIVPDNEISNSKVSFNSGEALLPTKNTETEYNEPISDNVTINVDVPFGTIATKSLPDAVTVNSLHNTEAERNALDDENKHTIKGEIKDNLKQKSDKKTSNFTKPSDLLKRRKIFKAEKRQEKIKNIKNKLDILAKLTKDHSSYNLGSQAFEQKIADRIKQIDSLGSSASKKLKNIILRSFKQSVKKQIAIKSRRIDNTKITKTNNTVDKVKQIQEDKLPKQMQKESLNHSDCNLSVGNVCHRIKYLQKFPCGNGKNISIEQLCDGAADCVNATDENNCTDRAAEKFKETMELITDIDNSITNKCYPQYNGDLKDMLSPQWSLYQNYRNFMILPKNKTTINITSIMGDSKDVGISISTLMYVLKGALCVNLKFAEITDTASLTLDPDNFEIDELKTVSDYDVSDWSPKSCSCQRENCANNKCDRRCKLVCWQKHILNHWGCTSINSDTSVSLDVICDGKLDCTDKTDEEFCAAGSSASKYEANTLYSHLIEELTSKSVSAIYEQNRKDILALMNLAHRLQKLSTLPDADVKAIKTYRNEYFTTIVHIYEDLLLTSNMEKLDQAHDFLLLISEKMVEALKRSHTGNKNVTSLTGCYCRDNTCALLWCSRECTARCLVDSEVTKYSCNASDVYVPIEAVCNGKIDCPNEDDEKDCSNEICRTHHLVVLSHQLKNIKTIGTVLEAGLGGWKDKALAFLATVGAIERPNHNMVENIVGSILRDLVTMYSTMEDIEKINTKKALAELKTIANVVMQTLKSCRK